MFVICGSVMQAAGLADPPERKDFVAEEEKIRDSSSNSISADASKNDFENCGCLDR